MSLSGFYTLWFSVSNLVQDPDWIRIQSSQWILIQHFMFWSAGWSLLRAECFFCSLDVLYGGLGFFSNFGCKYFSIFGHQNPGSGSGSVFSLKCWIRIRIKWIRIRNTALIRSMAATRFLSGLVYPYHNATNTTNSWLNYRVSRWSVSTICRTSGNFAPPSLSFRKATQTCRWVLCWNF